MEYTDIELKNEKWKDIDGYDGMYQVSDLGRVRSRKSGEWKVMKPSKNENGYLLVDLLQGGKRTRKRARVHRLVAQAFIENDDETKTLINHIDECKHNNRVSNLEYCTASYNVTYNNLHHRRKRPQHYNCKRSKLKGLYDHNLTYAENLEIFRANGIDCSKWIVEQLRKDLGLINNKTKRDEIKDIYDQNLSIDENLEVFRENGIECCEKTVQRLRKDLGLSKKYTKRQ